MDAEEYEDGVGAPVQLMGTPALNVPADINLPPAAMMPGGLWSFMCEHMMKDIQRNHMMSAEEKDAKLSKKELGIPGKPAGRTIRIVEDPEGVVVAGATGTILWPAAVALIRYLDNVLGCGTSRCRAIELGAGLGAVSMFLAQHKAMDVVATDTPESIPVLTVNAKENFPSGGGPQVQAFRWGDVAKMQDLTETGGFDLVVGSDITYRSECVTDLITSINKFLKPAGSVFLSHQDRPGEASAFENALKTTKLRILERVETNLLDDKDEMSGFKFDDKFGGEAVKVFIYKLSVESTPSPKAGPKVRTDEPPRTWLTTAEVDAEFERITGIRPEPMVAEAATVPETAIESRAPSSGATMKDKVIQDFLGLGLGDYLFDVDEKLRASVNALPQKQRPRTETQRRQYAEAYYAGTCWEPPSPSVMAAISELSPAEASALCGTIHPVDADSKPAPQRDSVSPNADNEEPAPESPKARETQNEFASVLKCLKGLTWEAAKKEGCLVLTVSFQEDLWKSLSGPKGMSFREAIGFEIAEAEFRVMHVGAVVLDMRLAMSVDRFAAKAKLCSKRRRVIVHAPIT